MRSTAVLDSNMHSTKCDNAHESLLNTRKPVTRFGYSGSLENGDPISNCLVLKMAFAFECFGIFVLA
jgi:hypothetical protein